METFDRSAHWEKIYATKALQEVSWYQINPETSLELIHACGLDKNALIIDIGGGDSYLANFLLEDGFSNISVLDISLKALERAQIRLGEQSKNINWIQSDIVAFEPQQVYDLWHDRAAFHFLTSSDEIATYVAIASKAIRSGGYLVMGTFADDGPLKCSGITIQQYNEQSLTQVFGDTFEIQKLTRVEHRTPFDTVQKFIFGVFKRK